MLQRSGAPLGCSGDDATCKEVPHPPPGLPASRTGRLDVSPSQADPMSQDGREGTRTPSQTRLDLPLAAHSALTRLRHHPGCARHSQTCRRER